MKTKKWFTLIELIVIITILAILWTISFISLTNYSKESRDAKRINDVRSLLTKLNMEEIKGIPYQDMIKQDIPHTVIINKKSFDAYQWILDFQLLRESQKNFQDPESKWDYDFSTSNWSGDFQMFNFIQWRYWSEKNNKQMLLGNYYEYIPWTDSPNLFKDTLTWPNTFTNTPPITSPWNCEDISKPTDNWHISYNSWNPNNQNTPWTQSLSWDCTYYCIDWYTWTNCNIPPLWVHPDWNDLIVSDWTNSITIADRNLWAMSDDYTSTASYWSHYQWGRNDTLWTNWTVAMNSDWQTPQVNDAWWWVNDTATSTATYTSLRQWPCPPNYHVPSTEEWKILIKIWFAIKWKSCDVSVGTYCSFWTWNAAFANFQSDLKIPLAGYRNWNSGTVVDYGTYGRYWSSSPNGTEAYHMYLTPNNVLPQGSNTRAYGRSIRCFKNY